MHSTHCLGSHLVPGSQVVFQTPTSRLNVANNEASEKLIPGSPAFLPSVAEFHGLLQLSSQST
jgi:hypothetical protein